MAAAIDREVLSLGALVGDLLPELGHQLGGMRRRYASLAEHDAVEVEEHRRTADQGRQRGDDELQALLLEDDLGELLVHRQRALQHRVLLIDDLRGDGLGDGDEGHVVGHLEEREVMLVGERDHGVGHLLETEADPEAEPGDLGIDEPPADGRAARFFGFWMPSPVVSSSSPPRSHLVGRPSR